MGDLGIKLEQGAAAIWSGSMRSDVGAGHLYGVDSDNTLAESGVYNSFNSALKSNFDDFVETLNSDCDNLDVAAELFFQLDEDQASCL